MKKNSVTPPKAGARDISDTRRLNVIAALGNHAPHLGMNGKWHVTAHANRECWGSAPTLRECIDQVITGTGPEFPDESLIRALPPEADEQKSSSGLAPATAFTEGQKILKERQK
jgi:hypothetical protein